ncbi:hypothetical protein [Aquimarina pacifica]|uniref:hypothetical protein n=1 Tax=Aquimarina pacifica TaxID=1296415 RepID=UPI0004709BFD|nr:hypothetical protein [Aquimarina pacifica]
MKSNPTSIKYIEWKSAEELHENSLNWISELKFIKDEQHFLNELLENYMWQLISNHTSETSNKVIQELSILSKKIEPTLKKIIRHQNELLILTDGLDQIKEEKKYKTDHRAFAEEVHTYFNNYKDVKRKVFALIKKGMIQSKQKRLLS